MKVEVVGLEKHYGRTRAVQGISFEFQSGQIFGFVGPNGAGKSSTMRILATMDEPTQGDALIDGISVVEDPEKAHHLVGYVPDNLPGHRDISVHEYLDFFARAYGMKGQHRKKTVEGIEEFTNLIGIRDKFLSALSKGMKNRVSVARALVHNPPVLIMDEPAAGLDPRARIELRELLKELANQGKAILISSHILTELSEICHGAVFIERGKILRAGTLDAIKEMDKKPHSTVVMKPMDRLTELHRHLLQQPGIEAVRAMDKSLEIDVLGEANECCDLLTNVIQAGYRLLEFKQLETDLEQIFMNVTKGEVA
jgi:ABC-2 type transport system ATP-binding protein